MKKYILDTDIGDDIDDAYALNLALNNDVNLIGITTVFNNTKLRAKLAKKMTILAKKDIPCYFGKSRSLDGHARADIYSQYSEDLENYPIDNKDEEEAIDFIITSAKKYQQDLYIICIGPLTNIASAILKDSKAMSKIGGIIMMGGDYVNQYAEWNISCDIKAAKIVLESDIDITAFGHEWTSKLKLTEEEQNKVLNNNKSKYYENLATLNKLWLQDKKEGWKVVLHDVTTIRYILDNTYCKIKRIPIYVEDKGEATLGMTCNLSLIERFPKKHYINVCIELDIEEFKKYFLNDLLGGKL